MENSPIAVQLNACRIPRFTHYTTLTKEGYPDLSKRVQDRSYKIDNRLQNYHLQSTAMGYQSNDGFTIIALLAKEITISGIVVLFNTPTSTISNLQAHGNDVVPMYDHPNASRPRGPFYLAVPYLFDVRSDPSKIHTTHEWAILGNYLADHVYSGGGLLVSGSGKAEPTLKLLGGYFTDLYNATFESILLR